MLRGGVSESRFLPSRRRPTGTLWCGLAGRVLPLAVPYLHPHWIILSVVGFQRSYLREVATAVVTVGRNYRFIGLLVKWRRGGDSNPRSRFCQDNCLAGSPVRPLQHLSAAAKTFGTSKSPAVLLMLEFNTNLRVGAVGTRLSRLVRGDETRTAWLTRGLSTGASDRWIVTE